MKSGGPVSLSSKSKPTASMSDSRLCKREIGRKMCEAAGCTHFMPMDCDEFYKTDELTHVKKVMLDNDYEGAACKMRFFFKYPTQELLPTDDMFSKNNNNKFFNNKFYSNTTAFLKGERMQTM